MQLKPPLTLDKQIEKLKEHNIIISDSTHTKAVLYYNNYYRLSGYALQYRKDPKCSDCIDGTFFDEILRIYQFDSDLRNCIRKYVEIAELYYRAQIAYHFSLVKCAMPPHDQHYNDSNYCNKKGFNEIIRSFSKQRDYYKDSLIMKHHKNKYGDRLPLWAIMELLSFSNLSKLYSAMYISEQTLIANAVGTGPKMLKNHLHCLSILRNKCAHSARLYNIKFSPPAQFSSAFLRSNPELQNDTLFAYIIVLLRRLPDTLSKKTFAEELSILVRNRPCGVDIKLMGFTNDWEKCILKQID